MTFIAVAAFYFDACSVIMNQISFALQKKAQKEVGDKSSVFGTSKGIIALILLITAALIHGWAVNFADLTLLSVNASIGIIANAFIASRFLGERFDWWYDLQGLTLIAIGCTWIVTLSNKEKKELNFEELVTTVTKPQSLLFGLLIGVFFLMSAFFKW